MDSKSWAQQMQSLGRSLGLQGDLQSFLPMLSLALFPMVLNYLIAWWFSNGANRERHKLFGILQSFFPFTDLEYRLDYVLREGNLTSTYLSVLTSHTSYWSSPDCAAFVLMQLYDGQLEPSNRSTSQQNQENT